MNIFTAQNHKNSEHQQQNSPKKPQLHGSVWQDNGASLGRRVASTQRASDEKDTSGALLTDIDPHSLKKEKRAPKLERATIRMKRSVKAEITRMARQWKVKGKSLSFSAVCNVLLERAVQGHI